MLPPEDGTSIGIGFTGTLRHGAAIVACTREGLLFPALIIERPQGAPDDWLVDRAAVDAAMAELFERYDVARAVCHRAEWQPEIDRWSEQYGEKVVLQVSLKRERFGKMVDRFRSALTQGLVKHTSDAIFTRHVLNARLDSPPAGMYSLLRRPEPGRQIDGAIAACLALDAATAIPEDTGPGGIIVINLEDGSYTDSDELASGDDDDSRGKWQPIF